MVMGSRTEKQTTVLIKKKQLNELQSTKQQSVVNNNLPQTTQHIGKSIEKDSSSKQKIVKAKKESSRSDLKQLRLRPGQS